MGQHSNNFNLKVVGEPDIRGVRDINQHVLVLQGKTLIAVPEDGNVTPITLTTTPCRDESLEKDKGHPIYLGIADHKLCLCCAESGGKPQLKLEERDIMELYGTQKAEKSFVFFQNGNGNTSTFESAAYPGWFISSSEENGKPITMTKGVGKHNIHFYFNTRD
ncbi:interleukin-36 alpha-like [Trichosurus vulpecula]|uniref:interleukin-36 alpha-like n=1 Tax=Trichosurus vulpecula TaxID=9337 RepID=UPI00186AC8FE|nr:interleukin-36 alpha-like [Trichosurus vulpecula]